LTGSDQISTNNWKTPTSYTFQKPYLSNISAFITYARAYKKVNVITDINNIVTDSVNLYEGSVIIANSSILNKRNFLLLATGDITLNPDAGSNTFNSNNFSQAFISQGKIIISNDIQNLNGIFIANDFNMSGTNPLKIKGNIISNNSVTIRDTDSANKIHAKPSVFIIFDYQKYIDLMPYLSVVNLTGRTID
jgi:hypothetical protein